MTLNIATDEVLTPDTTAPTRPFPGLLASFLWIFLFFFLQIVGSAVALIAAIVMNGDPEEFLKNPEAILTNMSLLAMPIVWSLIVANGITLAGLLIYLSRKGRLDAIRFNNWSEMSLAKTLGVGVAVIAGALTFNYVYATYVIPGIELQADLKILFAAIPDTTFNAILLFIMVAVLAPVLEEFLFRGMLQNALKHKMPAYAAIALSAAIFSLAHVNWFAPNIEFYIFPPIFVLGAAFGFLYHITGSLRVCILLHLINNAAALGQTRIAEWLGSF